MKKFLCVCLVLLVTILSLASCGNGKIPEPIIIVSDDGYLIVNGIKTEHKVDKEDVITVEDGYVVVNGVKTEHRVESEEDNNIPEEKPDTIEVIDGYLVVNGKKTEHKVHTEPVISVIDGYVAVNGVKTEHKVHTEPVITEIDGFVAVNGIKTEYKIDKGDVVTVVDGYLVVNGIKTEYMISNCNHIWESKVTEPSCTQNGYTTMTCPLCDKSVTVNETDKIDHLYATSYTVDASYHWFKCIACDAAKDKEAHSLNDDGLCTICMRPISETPGVIYRIVDDGTYAEVIGYEGTARRVKIASEYMGVPVTNIYDRAFYESIASEVILPDSITTIGEFAFGYSSLTSIVIPDSVISIKDSAFQYCSYLDSISIGNNVATIGLNAFYGCRYINYNEYGNCYYLGNDSNPYLVLISAKNKNIINAEIHKDSKTIAEQAFSNCSLLTSIIIPDGVMHIGIGAFNSCQSLVSVVIPNNITDISRGAFDWCINLANIYYLGSEEEWVSLNLDLIEVNATIHYNYVPEE